MIGLLENLKVLEIADSKGIYCGKILADLGAQVLKVEKPDGDESRKIGPFKGDIPHPEGSLYFAYYNTNKKSITLNIETKKGQEIFKKLARSCDVVIETFLPGKMKKLGLDYQNLKRINTGIIMVSITGFGQTGPYKSYLANEIIGFAMSGVMYECGDPTNPPTKSPGQLTIDSASTYAAAGVLSALFNRLSTKRGCHIDVSIQEVGAITSYGPHISLYDLDGRFIERGGQRQLGDPAFGIYSCKDGHVHIGVWSPRQWKSLMAMMGNPEVLSDELWEDRLFRQDNRDVVESLIMDFTNSLTKSELFDLGQSHGVPCAPIHTIAEFVNHPQIKARGYFIDLIHPYLGKIEYPRAPYRMSGKQWRPRRAAPMIGQHNKEIYTKQLKYSAKELGALRESGII
jgi:crotonobetainyl-CoA:carnitine CoA-transferase CaiB-like acyl-CoA transferase